MHLILHNKHMTGFFMTPKLIEYLIINIPVVYNKRRFLALYNVCCYTAKAALVRAISQSKIFLPQ